MQTYKQQIEQRLRDLERKLCCISNETTFYDALVDFPTVGIENRLYVDNSTGDIYIWDGAAYVAPVGGGGGDNDYIETVANYTALRALTGYVPTVVNVADWTYTGPDGNTYTTLGGLFKKVPTGTENGGTIIVATDSTIWERQWDKIHVQPEWWECGGYDFYGDNYTDKNIISPSANIAFEGLGIFQAGIYNDRDRIQTAINIGHTSGNIIVVYQKRTYLIDKVLSNYNPILSSNINGEHSYNNATIKRINSPVTTLSANLNAAATSIQVVDASNFRVGQNLSVFSTISTHGGLGFDESLTLTITGITGNTITVLNSAPSKTYVIGDVVMLEVTLYDNRTYSGNIKYSNGYFDGNKLNGGGQRYPQDWRLNYGIAAGTSAINVVFENLEFKDNPAENVTAPAGVMVNCRGYNLDGSFFHYSMSDARYAQNLQTGFLIDGCYVDGVCLATDEVSNHNEAVITNSLHTEYIKLVNCNFKNGAEFIFAIDPVQSDTKCKFIISNNTFENFKQILISSVGSTNMPEREDGLIISNNMFYNCGDLLLVNLGHGNSMYEGLSFNDININNNIFVGSRFIFNQCTNINFNNNKILFRDELNLTYANYGIADIDTAPQLSVIYLSKSSKINIHDNFIENQYTENEKLSVGIAVPIESCIRMKDGGGNNLNYYYEQGISIKNNKILGFHYGINGVKMYKTSPTAAALAYGTIGWEFSNNYIVLSGRTPTTAGSSSNLFMGISAPPGCVVENNTIIQQREDNFQVGIWGINHDPFPATVTGIIGVIIRNNYIYMVNTSHMAISVGAFGNGFWNWNAVVVYNIIKGTIDGLNAARNYSIGNITLNTTQLPGFTVPEIPTFQSFEWNTVNY